jgi:hypothetical protein
MMRALILRLAEPMIVEAFRAGYEAGMLKGVKMAGAVVAEVAAARAEA